MFGRRNKREGSFQELVDLLDATDDPDVILGLFLMLRQRLPELRAGDPAIGAAIAPVHRAVLDGRLTDGLAITEGLRVWRELATVTAKPGNRALCSALLMDQGSQILDEARRRGDPRLVEAAVEFGRDAVAVNVPPGGTVHGVALTALSAALRERHAHHSRMADLTESIALARRSIEAMPADHSEARALGVSELVNGLLSRYNAVGDAAALQEAARWQREQVVLGRRERVPDDQLAFRLDNLANALFPLAQLTDDTAVMDEAVAAVREAIDLQSSADPKILGRFLSNFGLILGARSERLGGTDAQLDEAIAALRRAVAMSSDGAARASAQSNLSSLLNQRNDLRQKRAKVDHAGRAATQQAEAVASAGQPTPGLDELARYIPDGWPDADAAVRSAQAALLGIAPGHPRRQLALVNLGLALQDRLEFSADPADHEQALTRFREAAMTPGHAALRTYAAMFYADLAVDVEDWTTAAEGYRVAVEALPDLAPEDLSRDDQERALRSFSTLSADAAAAALRAGATATDALRLLESGRGVLLAQAMTLDTPGRATDPAPTQRLPDPVVAISESGLGCHAFIVSAGTVREFELDVEPGDVADRAAAFRLALEIVDGDEFDPVHRYAANRLIRATLSWLWDTITEPVLTVLGITGPAPPGARMPRVWWMPTGALSFLPLHAAGHLDTAGRTVLDRVVSSYTPTLRLLAQARTAAPSPGPIRPLVVAVPDAAGQSPLPTVMTEAGAVLRRFPDADVRTAGDARRAPVLGALPAMSWVHFACHALTDLARPSQSHLLLSDGPLSITDVSRLRIPDAYLAYLSACGTAQGGGELTDEAIHVSSMFQLAGFPHVVATLWPIGDAAAAAFATAFYDALDPADPAYAAHVATRSLRDAHGSRDVLSWAAHIHTGP